MKLYNYIALVVAFVTIASCAVEDPVQSTATNIPFTIDNISVEKTNFSEAAKTYEVPFTLGGDQIVPTKIVVSVDPSSTATEGEDFTLSTHTVEVPAFVKEGSFSITINEDLLAEGEESIVLNVEGGQDPFGISNPQQLKMNIQDSVYNDLRISFDFDNAFTYGSGSYTTCMFGNDSPDVDFYLFDADGNDTGDYQAATYATCPEGFIFGENYPDGKYTFAVNLWSNAILYGLGANVTYNVDASIIKGGAFSITEKMRNPFTSEDPDYANDGEFELRPWFVVNKTGTTFAIENLDGDVIVKGLKSMDFSHR